MASGFGPAPLPSLGLVLNGGGAGAAASLPSIGLLFGKGAVTGIYALSGKSASLKTGYRLVSATGAYSLTGIAATLSTTHGNSVQWPAPLPTLSLLLTGISGQKILVGNAGIFTVAGLAATLNRGHGIAADTGVFVLTGAPEESDFQETADSGSFVISGSTANLLRPRILPASTGVFLLTGSIAGLSYQTTSSRSLPALPAAFSLSGSAAVLTYIRALQADPGAFVLTGMDAGYTTSGHFELPQGGGARSGRAYIGQAKPMRQWSQKERDQEVNRVILQTVASVPTLDFVAIEQAISAQLEQEDLALRAVDEQRIKDQIKQERNARAIRVLMLMH